MLLGGTDQFIRRFVRSAGGVRQLESRYERYMRSEWSDPLADVAKLTAAVRWLPSSA